MLIQDIVSDVEMNDRSSLGRINTLLRGSDLTVDQINKMQMYGSEHRKSENYRNSFVN